MPIRKLALILMQQHVTTRDGVLTVTTYARVPPA